MSPRRSVAVLALGSLLLSATPSAAARRHAGQAPQPPVAPSTALERACHRWGTLAHRIVRDRNQDVSLVVTLAWVRRLTVTDGPAMQADGDRLVYVLYRDLGRTISPGQAQQAFEVGCLTAEPVTPRSPQY